MQGTGLLFVIERLGRSLVNAEDTIAELRKEIEQLREQLAEANRDA